MLIIRMDESDYYELDENDEATDEFLEENWEDDKAFMAQSIDDLKNGGPYLLKAVRSNWKGSTGTAEVSTGSEVIDKALSFGGSFIRLYRDGQQLYIRTATHDVPTGFNIYISKRK
jgi:hypothetical protein